MTAMTSEEQEVAAANEAFYAAVERGDLDALQDLWCAEETAVCVHPGAAPIHGTRNVLRSWALIMANTDYIQFFLTDVRVSVLGDVAVVTCQENVLTEVSETGDGNAVVVATNVYVRRGGSWRAQVHHGSPVLGQLVNDDHADG